MNANQWVNLLIRAEMEYPVDNQRRCAIRDARMSLQVAVQHHDATAIKRLIRKAREIAEAWGVDLPNTPPEPTWAERQAEWIRRGCSP